MGDKGQRTGPDGAFSSSDEGDEEQRTTIRVVLNTKGLRGRRTAPHGAISMSKVRGRGATTENTCRWAISTLDVREGEQRTLTSGILNVKAAKWVPHDREQPGAFSMSEVGGGRQKTENNPIQDVLDIGYTRGWDREHLTSVFPTSRWIGSHQTTENTQMGC